MNENAESRWTTSLSVGHETIDAQHRGLIDFLALLQQRIGDGDTVATSVILAEFIEFTHEHFAEEERLMRNSDYPQYLAHVMRHESLLEEIRQLKKSIDAGKTPVSLALLDYLRVWLFEHIKTSDRRLGRFLAGIADDAGAD